MIPKIIGCVLLIAPIVALVRHMPSFEEFLTAAGILYCCIVYIAIIGILTTD